MKFLFRKKWKRGKTFAEKLPWVAIQSDLLEATLGSRGSSRSNSPGPEEGLAGPGWCGRVCLLRVLQLTLLLATLAAAANFLASALVAVPAARPRPLLSPVAEDALPRAAPATLLDLDDFELLQEAAAACGPARLFFVFLVHSRPDHFRQRQAIRATWGGARDLGDGWAARTVFLLGRGGGGGGGEGAAPDSAGLDMEDVVAREAERHGDLVVGSFVDHYHNLTYKHVMALRWAARRCSHATFLVKADDDAFIDVPALRALLGRTFSLPPPRRTLACNVLPAGTRPQRAGKWAVSERDYPWPEYPRYCAGLSYVATPDVADLLARAAQAGVAPRVWVDDVWVTGLLTEALGLRPHYLNLRYSYDHVELSQWAAHARPAAAPPYIFVHLDPNLPDWRPVLDTLWSHALAAQNATQEPPTTTAPPTAS
ncbi:acetylgalactosaminyl-O-glycosyl-glycoprotein beta-1,3-N-acetylglucosaminyltransferase-like [Eriocheir sinensis]|uniref:acetylgalactosaminyl-O-glycosyl-glycoprotein beta-1,3-N-acetylglucosaminyltransferase-like n=1 Tax=Eriocheir sinensis TaxID=95602 RepID=UPI0021C63E46|nr:acetylgalactosaminyl-O-glycosyl-glycoprotein beta-1,3-N-acetylglucosaminyltransferase-like [Eriocheir sinensis]XP_050713572.1 acetylgalactosaminyl-O-glycosyl-glycoprotein beta-1,3-N-acetylglucosaminyltransferase-like [Eriocheir sinensis]XP_050713573.1 acetylgalactosaminyl-O-glycosyl-glycoprotein beta-1,3-N-acetylglucosaminyltransferase-like [Eriocheir sinensis]XP_050713574.1 acetylgalactosaminyl-O-glycosyl-glycoprotein beta-1,3-N-acetylglucosaminyltransferase-like [Eriocheir sinensis]XP_0507